MAGEVCRSTTPRAAGFQPAVRDVRRSQPHFPAPAYDQTQKVERILRPRGHDIADTSAHLHYCRALVRMKQQPRADEILCLAS